MKTTRTRMIGLAMAVGLLAGIMAPAAMAQDDVGVIVGGRAVVNQTLACTKDGGVDPTGTSGLVYPQMKDFPKNPAATANDKDRAYRFTGRINSVGKMGGDADVCGYLTKVAGIGPRCGMSKGYNGKGLVHYDNGDIDKIDQLTWKLSGAFFIVTANVWKYTDGTKQKPGRLYGIVVATPDVLAGESCSTEWNPLSTQRPKKPRGAQLFRVDAVLAIVQNTAAPDWNDITDPIDPKNDGKSGPTNPWGDKDNKKPDKTG